MEEGICGQIVEIQPVVVHEASDEGVMGESMSSEEVRDKYHRFAGLRGGDDLPWCWKPVFDLRRQVPRLPQILDVLLRYGGGHPLAVKTRYGHCWRSWGGRKDWNLGAGARGIERQRKKKA